MEDDLRMRRLKNEEEEVNTQKDYGELDPCILSLGPKVDNYGVKDMTSWTLKFKGREGSDLYPGVYEVRMDIPKSYPGIYPDCKFLHDFTHFHIFPGGSICLPLLKPAGWSSNKTMIELVLSIINMVHSDPKVGDEANHTMSKLYEKSKEEYKQYLRDQAKKMQNIK